MIKDKHELEILEAICAKGCRTIEEVEENTGIELSLKNAPRKDYVAFKAFLYMLKPRKRISFDTAYRRVVDLQRGYTLQQCAKRWKVSKDYVLHFVSELDDAFEYAMERYLLIKRVEGLSYHSAANAAEAARITRTRKREVADCREGFEWTLPRVVKKRVTILNPSHRYKRRRGRALPQEKIERIIVVYKKVGKIGETAKIVGINPATVSRYIHMHFD